MGPHRSGGGGARHGGLHQPRVVHAPRSGHSGGGGESEANAPPPSLARGFSRLDPATAAYYGEARDALADLEAAPPPFDKEQAGLLASAALREAAGRETAVSADATGSRALEALLPHAPAEDVLAFAAIVLGDGSALGDVATSQFGSHTSEVLIATLARLADGSAPILAGESDEGVVSSARAGATAALEATTRTAAAHFYDLASHWCGSHVLRALLCALAGRDVAPAGFGGRGDGGGGGDGAAALRSARRGPKAGGFGRPGGPPPVGLASKVDGGSGAGTAAAHPDLVRLLADTLLGADYAPYLEELVYGLYSGPAVQALLRAAAGQDGLLCALIPRLLGAPLPPEGSDPPRDGARLADIPKDTILDAAKDRAGSHLLEAVLSVAPRTLRVELDARALRGRLADLASHPTANFVVQAALAAADSVPAVKGALKELGPGIGGLLTGRRGGVVAALVAAAGRVPAVPGDVAAAVAAGLAASRPHPAGLAASLYTLDTPQPGATLADAGRGSAVGCALLAALLRLPAPGGSASPCGAGAAFADALASLPPPDFAIFASDSAGSRAVEALFTGPALGAKAVRSAAAKLVGRAAAVAATPGGAHAVEAAWGAASASDKDAITAELAAAEAQLGSSFRVLALLRRCGVADFKRRRNAGWGGGAPVPEPPTPGAAALPPAEEAEEEQEEDAAAKKKRKKEKKEKKEKKKSTRRAAEVEA